MALKKLTVQVALLVWVMIAPALPAAPLASSLRFDQDYFAAGEAVLVAEPIAGDLVCVGEALQVKTEIGGDLLVFGRRVEITGNTVQDAYIAGRNVMISGGVGHNTRIVAGSVRLETGAQMGGNVSITGNELLLFGDIDGYLLAAGAMIFIDGTIRGDVRAIGEAIELGPNARIHGNLLYSSKNPLKRDRAAEISGKLTYQPWLDYAPKWQLVIVYWIWTLGLVLLALLAMIFLPIYSGGVSQTLRRRPLFSPVLGMLALVFTPLLIVLFAVTGIGLPVALLLLTSYLTALLLGYVLACIALGDVILLHQLRRFSDRTYARLLAAAVIICSLSALGMKPPLGAPIALVALFAGLGAQLLWLRTKDAPGAAQVRNNQQAEG